VISPIAPRDLAQLLQDGLSDPALPGARVRVCDVRSAAAYLAGHIAGADHLPHEQAVRWIPQGAFTQGMVVLIDDDGAPHGPARQVAAELAHTWFRRLRYLQGGVAAWRASGLPLVEGGVAGTSAASHDGAEPPFQRSGSVPWLAPGETRAANPLGPRRG
jgi:rhodanese-related sulfurtransferase